MPLAHHALARCNGRWLMGALLAALQGLRGDLNHLPQGPVQYPPSPGQEAHMAMTRERPPPSQALQAPSALQRRTVMCRTMF